MNSLSFCINIFSKSGFPEVTTFYSYLKRSYFSNSFNALFKFSISSFKAFNSPGSNLGIGGGVNSIFFSDLPISPNSYYNYSINFDKCSILFMLSITFSSSMPNLSLSALFAYKSDNYLIISAILIFLN